MRWVETRNIIALVLFGIGLVLFFFNLYGIFGAYISPIIPFALLISSAIIAGWHLIQPILNFKSKPVYGSDSSTATALGISQGMINVVKFLIAISLVCSGVMTMITNPNIGLVILVAGILVFLDVQQTEQRLAAVLSHKK